jgi:hypothetical protein
MPRRRWAIAVAGLAVLLGLALWWTGPFGRRSDEESIIAGRERSTAGRGRPLRVPGRLSWMTGDLPAVRVSGVVLENGAPRSGARVELHSWTTAAGAREVDRVVTDERGRFDLGWQDPAMSVVIAWAGDAEARRPIDLGDPMMSRGAAALVLELAPCPRRVRGRVVDDERRPVADVPIQSMVNVRELALVPTGRSWQDGRFSVCASGQVVAGGGAWGLVTLPPLEQVGDVVVLPSMTVRGTVADRGGAPVAGALVWAIGNLKTTSFMRGVPASTGDDGRFEVRLGPGCYDLFAMREGRGAYKPDHVCGAPGDEIEAEPIVLDPCTLAVDGVVKRRGAPVGGLVVRLGSRSITDPAERFSFPCVSTAEQLVVDGHRVAPAIDLTGKTGHIDLEVNAVAGARIHGRVTAAGQPVGNAHVEMVAASAVGNKTVSRPPQPWTRSQPDGFYQLRAPPGRHQLNAISSDRRRAQPRWIDVPSDAGDIGVDLELDAGDSLHGIALQESGKLAAGVRLTLRPRLAGAAAGIQVGRIEPGQKVTRGDLDSIFGSFERVAMTTTAGDGRFGFGDLEPGAYTLEVFDRSWRLADGKDAISVDVKSGQDNEIEIVFADRAGLSLRGRVVGPDGRAMRYARVYLDLTHHVIVDPDGAFAIDDLAPGDYELKATSADGRLTTRVTSPAGGPPLTLHLK